MSDKMYLCDEYKLYFKIEDDVEAVSYTHLDVYKRQVLVRLPYKRC